ncbi:MAG: ATP-binding cassette domain-containing protein [Propionicimonas sp.]|nr:ATP-binding cassette domain-containing protein [Propionicimonas sp.]
MAESTLAVRDLRFAYRRGAEELFGGLSHDFEPGQVTAVTGPSGRGKSTLLHVLGLLLTPTAGEVLLDGRDVSRVRDSARSAIRASRVGFVFQDSELDQARKVIDSVLEPALYAGNSRQERLAHARELLDRFGLAERANHRPGQVSGGQAQRLAVCRALLNSPDIVLADEPTGNLDRGNAELVLQTLRSTAVGGSTVIVATHDPFVLDQVDRLVAL